MSLKYSQLFEYRYESIYPPPSSKRSCLNKCPRSNVFLLIGAPIPN